MELTERQARELDYHREHFQNSELLKKPFSYAVLDRPERRWWNAYWAMYAYLKQADLRGKRVLVVGCGAGEDALRIAKLGANVCAFDLSPEAIAVCGALAEREGLSIDFDIMPAELLGYKSRSFDAIVARDILHHVDIRRTLPELVRVSKPGALWVINEIYSHSFTDRIRNSSPVKRFLYPAMQKFVYASDKPYITEDERKLTELDMAAITRPLDVHMRRYYNFIVTRLIPDKWDWAAKADRLLLKALPGSLLAGRVLLAGRCSG